MTDPSKQLINMNLTRNEWYAVIASLEHTAGAAYVIEHGGVNLADLADQIKTEILARVQTA